MPSGEGSGFTLFRKISRALERFKWGGKISISQIKLKVSQNLVKLSEYLSKCHGLRNQYPWEFRGIKVHEECSISLSVKSPKVANDW